MNKDLYTTEVEKPKIAASSALIFMSFIWGPILGIIFAIVTFANKSLDANIPLFGYSLSPFFVLVMLGLLLFLMFFRYNLYLAMSIFIGLIMASVSMYVALLVLFFTSFGGSF